MIRFSRFAAAVLCCAIQVLQVSVVRGEEKQNVVDRIRDAWQQRADDLKNFQCTCSLNRIEQTGGGLFDEPEPGGSRPIGLDDTFTLTMSGTKIALKSINEQWDTGSQSIYQQSISSSFDGSTNKVLHIGGKIVKTPFAHVKHDPKLGEELSKNTNYFPVCLSFYPGEMLTRKNFDLARMTVSDDRAVHQGDKCIEVRVPRRHDVSSCNVCVDPSRGFVPVKFVEWRTSGEMRYDIEIEYAENQDRVWVISSWVSKLNGVNATSTGTVTSTAINAQLKDDAFDIAFPVGTRISEFLNGTRKGYIQEANGVRREITQRDAANTP